MMMLRFPLFLIATCGAALAADGWSNLFNGKDLNGWVQRGGVAKYAVEDGCIVAT